MHISITKLGKGDKWGPSGLSTKALLFLIYAKDLPNQVDSYLNMFVDDANIMKEDSSNTDCEIL